MSISKADEASHSISDEDILSAIDDDPDARPLTSEDFQRMRQTPRVKIIRRALRLSQAEFSARYGIPLVNVEQWESRATLPDDVALSYLRAIAADPDGIANALSRQRAS